jgi:hypothetical protein
VHWECIGSALGVHWECIGSALGVHWECIGSALGLHWDCIGSAWECMGLHGSALNLGFSAKSDFLFVQNLYFYCIIKTENDIN